MAFSKSVLLFGDALFQNSWHRPYIGLRMSFISLGGGVGLYFTAPSKP